MKFSSFYKGEMVKLIKRLLLLTVLFIIWLSSAVSAGTMEDLLFNSILNNDKKMFKMAIDNGADVNAYDQYKQTPLGAAVYRDNLDFVNELIAKGADINRNSYYVGMGLGNVPPLSIAVAGDNLKIAKVLVNAGADVNGESENDRNTPLIIAIDKNVINLEMVGFLLGNKADVNKSNKYGLTPLMVNTNGFVILEKQKRMAIAQVLLSLGADPNIMNIDMKKALDIAISKNFVEMMELLLPVTKK